jgi:putative oxygen-independent coproporphyrinogen III oxidase
MSALATPPLSLYVHFPWCVRKCPYCDFNSYTLNGTLPQEPYLARLARDLEAQAADVKGRPILSVFLGGGTPSLFAPEAIGRLLEAARTHLTLAADAEVTLEANPGTIERGRFAAYRDAGVTRVSLGAQSFDPRALSALGRIHSPAETQRAAEELHAAGLSNFNLDLMYALPGQELAGALTDIEAALELHPAQVSHYQLTLEPGTPFAAQPPELPDEDVAASMLAACGALLAEAGYAQYEVSAYARAGAQCRHNLNYWTFGDYLGVGAGAHGKLTYAAAGRIVRTRQWRESRRYLSGADAALSRRDVPPADLPFEFMLNALRLTGGFAARLFPERTGLDLRTVEPQIAAAMAKGLLLVSVEGYRPSALGLQFLNDLLLGFLPEKSEKSYVSEMSTGAENSPFRAPRGLYSQASEPSLQNE